MFLSYSILFALFCVGSYFLYYVITKTFPKEDK